MPNNINPIHMKKTYLSPEVEITRVTFEANILSNGQNLNSSIYGSRGDADDDLEGFWD